MAYVHIKETWGINIFHVANTKSEKEIVMLV